MGESSNVNRDNLRGPMLVMVGLLLSVATIILGQINTLHNTLEQRIQWIEQQLSTKADKTQASDRYTGKEAILERAKNANAHKALQREFMNQVDALRREIDHIHDMIEDHNNEKAD